MGAPPSVSHLWRVFWLGSCAPLERFGIMLCNMRLEDYCASPNSRRLFFAFLHEAFLRGASQRLTILTDCLGSARVGFVLREQCLAGWRSVVGCCHLGGQPI